MDQTYVRLVVCEGKKSVLEVKLRQGNAQHLLEIDGDYLPHVHNASKKITEQFDQFIEIYSVTCLTI